MGRIMMPRQLFLVKTRHSKGTHAQYLVSFERYNGDWFQERERNKATRLGLEGTFNIRVIAGPKHTLGNNADETILRVTPVPREDLPLYLGMEWQSDLFRRMLKDG